MFFLETVLIRNHIKGKIVPLSSTNLDRTNVQVTKELFTIQIHVGCVGGVAINSQEVIDNDLHGMIDKFIN